MHAMFFIITALFLANSSLQGGNLCGRQKKPITFPLVISLNPIHPSALPPKPKIVTNISEEDAVAGQASPSGSGVWHHSNPLFAAERRKTIAQRRAAAAGSAIVFLSECDEERYAAWAETLLAARAWREKEEPSEEASTSASDTSDTDCADKATIRLWINIRKQIEAVCTSIETLRRDIRLKIIHNYNGLSLYSQTDELPSDRRVKELCDVFQPTNDVLIKPLCEHYQALLAQATRLGMGAQQNIPLPEQTPDSRVSTNLPLLFAPSLQLAYVKCLICNKLYTSVVLERKSECCKNPLIVCPPSATTLLREMELVCHFLSARIAQSSVLFEKFVEESLKGVFVF
jgi:hypothetical protein